MNCELALALLVGWWLVIFMAPQSGQFLLLSTENCPVPPNYLTDTLAARLWPLCYDLRRT